MAISTWIVGEAGGKLWVRSNLVELSVLMRLKSTAKIAGNVSFCYNLGRNQHFHSPY